MTREEFGEMFALSLYRKVRKTYLADGTFPDLYDKIKPEVDARAHGASFVSSWHLGRVR